MKIITVVGARPQFVKVAAVSRKLRKYCEEILVHTGQHYDDNMSDVFFKELDIPRPDYFLQVGSASHAKQTADMLVKIEEILIKEKPDCLLVYGDTNSTLAAALAAVKLTVPIIHIEAGVRDLDMNIPEEQNRVIVDHISSVLFCSTDTAVRHLKDEGIVKNVYQVGDVMCDAVLHYKKKIEGMNRRYFIEKLQYLYDWNQELESWYLATVHRPVNTQGIDKIEEILAALEMLNAPVIFPVHPRTQGLVNTLCAQKKYKNICFVEPLGYLEMLYFTGNAIKIVTDSGGLQKEAYILGKNVVTLYKSTGWVETLRGNHNILSAVNKDEIVRNVMRMDIEDTFEETLYGNGKAADKIIDIILSRGC